jgi:hypothetical protein
VKVAALWSYSVGEIPDQVTVYEREAKGGTLYLRWRARRLTGERNWSLKSLKVKLRDERGRVQDDVREWATQRAREKYNALIAPRPNAVRLVVAVTIAESRRRVTDPLAGRYPVDSGYRRSVLRALDYAASVWGATRPWGTVTRTDLRALWRRRLNELRAEGFAGVRGAEILISRILTVSQWLKDEGMLLLEACVAPKHWKQELRADWATLSGARTDYQPDRPRHSVEELRKILAVAHRVDPRLHLALELGAEMRNGQVVRALRSDLDLEAGTFKVPGRGKKRGALQVLTAGQLFAAREAVTTGYLRDLERAGGDYPLFPAGQMPGGRSAKWVAAERHRTAKPVGTRTMQDYFHAAEGLAGVARVKGRAFYGLRRAHVDATKAAGISREGLKAAGGWADSQMPDMIYSEQDARYAADEAARHRATVRGES